MANAQYVQFLVTFGKLNPSNVGKLEEDLVCIYNQIREQGGQRVTSVTIPGQTTTWGETMTLADQGYCLAEAIGMLNNTSRIIRRTVNRNWV